MTVPVGAEQLYFVGLAAPAASSATRRPSFSTPTTPATALECRLDGGAFQPCRSPKIYIGLTAGGHSFGVRSAVPGGVDPTPAIREWTVTKSK